LNTINFLKTTAPLRSKKSYLFNDTVYMNSPLVDTTNQSMLVVDKNAANNNKSWLFYNHFVNTNALLEPVKSAADRDSNDEDSNDLHAVNNPYKALIVVNGRTSEILTVNNVGNELFGCTSEVELIGKKLTDLLDLEESGTSSTDETETAPRKTNTKLEILMEADRLDKQGNIVLCSGKIFDAIINNGQCRLPISVYIVKLTDEAEPKCLCVMEPIQRVIGTFAINIKVDCVDHFLII
jgi:hypothetical protein